MNQNNGSFGIIVGGIVALAAAVFIFSGGQLGGKKTIEGDRDLPPVVTSER
jgi:myosin-crossreactive antigen